MASIALKDVTKRYPDGTEAVKRLDLDIDDGDFMILVGPSGCGKSTALRMIAGLEEITEGTLEIGSQVVNQLPPKARDVAMVFQSYALYPQMSVRENIGFPLRLAKTTRPVITERVDAIAALLDLEDHLARRPGQLSGGQRQRVAMGRSMVREPKAFLMDEPLSNLDAKLRVRMRTEIARLQRRLGTTTVYVTHDQTEAMTLGHRVAVMRDGVLQQVGTPRELYARPANRFVAGFIGSPAMNLMDGLVRDGRVELQFGSCDLGSAAPGDGPIVAGIRPEALRHGAVPSTAAASFDGVVEVVELHGADTFVHLRPAAAVRAPAVPEGDAVIARLHGALRPSVGDVIPLWVAAPDLHLFDLGSGLAVATAGR